MALFISLTPSDAPLNLPKFGNDKRRFVVIFPLLYLPCTEVAYLKPHQNSGRTETGQTTELMSQICSY